jgi:prepilin-type processing-associated H-X9-DG protein
MARSLGCYRCPADNYASIAGVRNRTISMNSYVGDFADRMAYFGNGAYRVYNKTTDFTRPGPSLTFVFLDECPDTLNDGLFQVNMTTKSWSDVVGSLHDGGGTFAFADGHAELRKWKENATKQRVTKLGCPSTVGSLRTGSPIDYGWLQERSSALK